MASPPIRILERSREMYKNHRRLAYDLMKTVLRYRGEVMPPDIERPLANVILFRKMHILCLLNHLVRRNIQQYLEFTIDDEREFQEHTVDTLNGFIREIISDFSEDDIAETLEDRSAKKSEDYIMKRRENNVLGACAQMTYATAYFAAKFPNSRSEYIKTGLDELTAFIGFLHPILFSFYPA